MTEKEFDKAFDKLTQKDKRDRIWDNFFTGMGEENLKMFDRMLRAEASKFIEDEDNNKLEE